MQPPHEQIVTCADEGLFESLHHCSAEEAINREEIERMLVHESNQTQSSKASGGVADQKNVLRNQIEIATRDIVVHTVAEYQDQIVLQFMN